MDWVVECIEALLPHAPSALGLTLTLENHYKDNYWSYPEFAQDSDVFLRDPGPRSHSPRLGVNYDPSNALLAGEDPLDAAATGEAPRGDDARQRPRPATRLHPGRPARPGRPALGYAAVLQHGEIGTGLNDYDAIFTILRDAGLRRLDLDRGRRSRPGRTPPLGGSSCATKMAAVLARLRSDSRVPLVNLE